MTINLRKITQGERGTLTFTWEFPENLTSPASISGAVITATMTDEDGVTTPVSGTLTGTAATTCTWALSAGDSGTAGTFTVVFKAVATGVTTYTLEATLEVIANPSATAAQNEPLVGVSATDAAWVALAATAVPDGGDVVDANDLGTAAAANVGDFDAAGAAATVQTNLNNHDTPAGHANDDGAIQFGTYDTKRNFLFNLDTIPDVEVGIPLENVGYRGFYFVQARSHFASGRFNHKSTWGGILAQYSSRFGWSNEAVDPYPISVDGDQAKGQFMAGYGNLGWSPYSVGLGMYNALTRTGYALGRYNYVGVAPNPITVHTWIDANTAAVVGVNGDQTASFPVDRMVVIYGCSNVPGNTNFHLLNKVTSSSYNGGTGKTTINLLMPIEYQLVVSPGFTDADGILQVPYITPAPTTPGSPLGGAFGKHNSVRADSYAVGTNHLLYSDNGVALGKQAIVKNKGEIAAANGYFVDGASLRFSQASRWIVKKKTAVTTATALTIDGAAVSTTTNQIVLNEGAAYRFKAQIAGILTTRADAAVIEIEGLVFRNGSNTLTIVGQSTVATHAGASMGSPTAEFVVDSTNRAIQVTVTPGVASVTIWSAEVSAAIVGMDIPNGAT